MKANLIAFAGLFLFVLTGCEKNNSMSPENFNTDIASAKKGGGDGGSTVNLKNGLVAYYPFNGNALDAGVNRYNGVVFNATLTADRFGVKKRAYSFNGTTSYIYAQGLNQSTFEYNKDFSISLYAYFRNYNSDYPHLLWGENGFIVFQGNGGANQAYDIGRMTFYVNEQNSTLQNGRVHSNIQMTTNQWHNIVVIKSGLSMSMYIDGNVVANSPYYNTGNPLVAGAGMFFGKAQATGFTFGMDGNLDDIRIYNRPLTVSEVAYLASN